MKITPLEIRQHEFEKTFRGYNIEEVDNFLANLSQEWERILNESKMLRMQLEMAEKEASKLREIEMTLFKTLKTAEDTSTMITEQANQQADKHIQESKLKSEQVLQEAYAKAEEILQEAQNRATYIKEDVLAEVKLLEQDFKTMDQYKTKLLAQMRSLSHETLDHVRRFEEKFDKEGIEEKIKEASDLLADVDQEPEIIHEEPEVEEPKAPIEEVEEIEETILTQEPEEIEEEAIETEEEVEIEEEVEEDQEEVYAENEVEATPVSHIEEEEDEIVLQSSANDIIEEGPVEEQEAPQVFEEEPVAAEPQTEEEEAVQERESDELEVIEGIGPKIAMLLYDSGIFTFNDLASTPVARIREILENAGPAYAMHDPSTWVEQALLAAEGRFEELEEMKGRLVGGRVVEDVEEKGIDSSVGFFDTIGETEGEVIEEPAEAQKQEEPEGKVEAPQPEAPKPSTPAQENNIESITEEMLEKVNKVKAAIRKAMVEKADSPSKDSSPLPTVNDVIGKSTDNGNGGGSFFDNI
ncbi:DivIVA domain-containing protein [Emticicia soli]|uniref:DivIVA domain-containing protein n=1 Tax=Emticicia soli TaxID=2027878 RepID=A0ABW5JAF7_9BACT